MSHIVKLLMVLLIQLSFMPLASGAHIEAETMGISKVVSQQGYLIELKRWGIYNDNSHPVETTKGINEALKWAGDKGIKAVSLPAGTYLIDKNSYITMVGNMTFALTEDVIIQKESNALEHYRTLVVPYGADNVTLIGGVYRGDKDTHDYSEKEHAYTAGTHESGYGIFIQGARNVKIEGVKSYNFTGDGLILTAHGVMAKDLYENHFESGAFNASGKAVVDKTKIRTKTPLVFTNSIYKTERYFEMSNPIHLPASFDLYFYKKNGQFLLKKTDVKARDIIEIPKDADHFHLVFSKTTTKNAYIEMWTRVDTYNAVVQNSEFSFNRRQGITVAGANKALIQNNVIHDIKGTAPQGGIDVEGGFGENGYRNSDITIKGNSFYNNAAYDIILYDGRDAVVEGNHLASKGVIGLAVSDPFTGAVVRNNHFDGTRIIAAHDVTFKDNVMNDSYTTLSGPNIVIDGMEFTDSMFSVSATQPWGVKVSNVTVTNTKKSNSGFSVWGQPIHVKNMKIIGEPVLRSFSGGVAEGSIFDNVEIIGYNATYGLSLPPGTYNNCKFESADTGKLGIISIGSAGKYVFDGCEFISNKEGGSSVVADHKELDLTIKNSSFIVKGNSLAFYAKTAKSVVFANNDIEAMNLSQKNVELLKVGDYWKRNDPFLIAGASIINNTFTANIDAIGISTVNAGKGAPAYTVENNKLYKAIITLKSNDKSKGNEINQ